MSTVRPGVMKKAPFDQAKADACQIVKPAFSLTAEDVKTEVLSVEKAAEKLVDPIGADVIVSAVSYTHLTALHWAAATSWL